MNRLLAIGRWLLPTVTLTVAERRMVFLMWAAGVAVGYVQALPVDTLPYARLDLGLSAAQMGTVLAVVRVGALAALPFSLLGDRQGRRRSLLIAFAVMVIAAVATAVAADATTFTALQALARAGATAVGILAVVLVAEELRPSVRAWGIGAYAAATSFGAGLALVALPLAEAAPDAWRRLFLMAAVALVVLVLLRRWLPESRLFFPDAPRPRWTAPFSGANGRRLLILATIAACAAAFGAPSVSFVFERLINELALPARTASLVSLVGGTVGGVGFFVGGRAADRWGRRVTFAAGLALSTLGAVAIYHVAHVGLVGLAAFASAFGSFAASAPFGALRTELFTTSVRATAGLWVNAAGVLGAIGGLVAAGMLIERFDLGAAIAFLTVFVVPALALVLLLPETRGQVLAPNTRG